MVSRETVEHWCIRKLAEQISSGTTKTIPDTTGKLDWTVAEAYIKCYGSSFLDNVTKALIDKNATRTTLMILTETTGGLSGIVVTSQSYKLSNCLFIK